MSKVLEIRADTATIIIDRPLKAFIDLKEGGTLLVKDVLAHNILTKLGLQRTNVWNGTDLEAHDRSMYFKVRAEKLEIQIKGSFFALHPNWEKRLNDVLSVIREENLNYRFTRFDVLYLTRKNIFPYLKKSDFRNMDTALMENKKEPFWFNTFSTIFGLVYYDKNRQLKKIKKKNPEYVKAYEEKFGTTEPLYHFEIRQLLFRRKDRKQIVTEFIPSVKDFPFRFEKVREEIEVEILKRVKLHREIIHLIKGGK